MPRKIIPLINNEFYHLVNRGVEQRNLFLDDEDRLRFTNSLLVFNDEKPAPWNMRKFWDGRTPGTFFNYTPEKPLVEIHAFSLMNNHFHLLIRQLRNNGISQYMRKIGGYASFFNKKYKRIGSLFQGRFKVVPIQSDSQLINTFIYIHTNPVELFEPGWKEFEVKNPLRAVKSLDQYRWSSYLDYIGKENFKSIITKDFFSELLGSDEECRRVVEARILDKAKISQFEEEIVLE